MGDKEETIPMWLSVEQLLEMDNPDTERIVTGMWGIPNFETGEIDKVPLEVYDPENHELFKKCVSEVKLKMASHLWWEIVYDLLQIGTLYACGEFAYKDDTWCFK